MDNLLDLLFVGIVVGFIIGLFPAGKGFGRFGNVLVGVIGAILGSFVYQQFLTGVLNLNLPTLKLDLNQVIIALVGAVLFILILKLIKR